MKTRWRDSFNSAVCVIRVRHDNTRERLNYGREQHITEQEIETEEVRTREGAIPLKRRKKVHVDGAIWKTKKRGTEAEMDGLCQPSHESHRNNTR